MESKRKRYFLRQQAPQKGAHCIAHPVLCRESVARKLLSLSALKHWRFNPWYIFSNSTLQICSLYGLLWGLSWYSLFLRSCITSFVLFTTSMTWRNGSNLFFEFEWLSRLTIKAQPDYGVFKLAHTATLVAQDLFYMTHSHNRNDLLVVSTHGHIYCLHKKTGSRLWRSDFPGKCTIATDTQIYFQDDWYRFYSQSHWWPSNSFHYR